MKEIKKKKKKKKKKKIIKKKKKKKKKKKIFENQISKIIKNIPMNFKFICI